MTDSKKVGQLVSLGETSQLKYDLNRGVASLARAQESHFRPHISLNAREGIDTIVKIAENPDEANTEFCICAYPDIHGDNFWLNVRFFIFLGDRGQPNDCVMLSPRQTAYIVQRLPDDSQRTVLEAVKTWYLTQFRRSVEAGLDAVDKAFKEGTALLVDDYYNRIFDIQRPRAHEIYFTEGTIVGDELASVLLTGVTMFDLDKDGFQEADELLLCAEHKRKETAGAMLSLVRGLHGENQTQ